MPVKMSFTLLNMPLMSLGSRIYSKYSLLIIKGELKGFNIFSPNNVQMPTLDCYRNVNENSENITMTEY